MSCIAGADEALCSIVTVYETGVVLIRKKIEARAGHATALAEKLGLQVVPFTKDQVATALEADRRYGKGMGRRPFLNLGDCISYALSPRASTRRSCSRATISPPRT